MALATMPPAIEIVEAFDRKSYQISRPQSIVTDPYWTGHEQLNQPSWKLSALSKISTLQNVERNVPGLGDLRPSDRAVAEIEKAIDQVWIQSLPLPTVAPVSGGAIFISWHSGKRSVEATAYHDGEIVIEGLENRTLIDDISHLDLPSALKWLLDI